MALLPYYPPETGSNPVWYPINAAQITALESTADILLYGGGSGGGKTDFLVADAMQERDNPKFKGIILRRSWSDFDQIADRCRELYRPFGGRSSNGGRLWTFPSGATVQFRVMKYEKDWEGFQGKPFTWLGIDEGGHQTESRIRKIMAWLVAPVGSGLRRRCRITANPGGIGAGWLMNLFLGGQCPIHGKRVIEPGVVYKGSRWMSDNKPTMMTTCFVPALVGDNPFYGQDKIDALKMQEGALADKLLQGCWCELEGAYFPFIKPSTDDFISPFQYPLAELNPQWWWNHFISIDYGYGNSSAAAILFAVEPTGRRAPIECLLEKRKNSTEFAEMIRDAWILPALGDEGERRTMVGAYYDPAMNAHTGTGKSNADMMGEVLDPAGCPMIEAAKDRIGGAQALHRALSCGDLIICDTASQVYESLRTRIHDDKPGRAGDVKKVHGDPMDDIYDATVYGNNNYAPGTEVPQDIAAQKRLQEYRDQGMDEHSLGIYSMKMRMGFDNKPPEPMRIGRARKPARRR